MSDNAKGKRTYRFSRPSPLTFETEWLRFVRATGVFGAPSRIVDNLDTHTEYYNGVGRIVWKYNREDGVRVYCDNEDLRDVFEASYAALNSETAGRTI